MKLGSEFIRLPLRYDAGQLRAEVSRFGEEDWRAHPQKFAGNSALVLVARAGGANDDLAGTMQPTAALKRCEYVMQLLASLGTVVGRARLMRLDPGAEVELHADLDYYWRDRVRIHVPIVTDPGVEFHCGERTVHMAAGEAWVFDNWRPHQVVNRSEVRRIHLVVDTVGSAGFWHLVAQGEIPFGPPRPGQEPPRLIPYQPGVIPSIPFEHYNVDAVMHPAALQLLVADTLSDLQQNPARNDAHRQIAAILRDLVYEWRALWALHGPDPNAPAYRQLLEITLQHLRQAGVDRLRIPSNGASLAAMLSKQLGAALASGAGPAEAKSPNRPPARPVFERPVFIIAAPRSGSTLLFELLARHPALWTVGGESHYLFENIPALHPAKRQFDSNVLLAADATPQVRDALLSAFALHLRDHHGNPLPESAPDGNPPIIRFLEKTPKNALRIQFLNEMFPDARFIFLFREPRGNISSIIDGWRSGRYITYQDLPGWQGPPWSFLLPPGWRDQSGRPLAEIAAFQWSETNRLILEALGRIPDARWCALEYADLVTEPGKACEALFDFMNLPCPEAFRQLAASELPLSRHTLTAPSPDKWRHNAKDMAAVLPWAAKEFHRLAALTNRLTLQETTTGRRQIP